MKKIKGVSKDLVAELNCLLASRSVSEEVTVCDQGSLQRRSWLGRKVQKLKGSGISSDKQEAVAQRIEWLVAGLRQELEAQSGYEDGNKELFGALPLFHCERIDPKLIKAVRTLFLKRLADPGLSWSRDCLLGRSFDYSYRSPTQVSGEGLDLRRVIYGEERWQELMARHVEQELCDKEVAQELVDLESSEVPFLQKVERKRNLYRRRDVHFTHLLALDHQMWQFGTGYQESKGATGTELLFGSRGRRATGTPLPTLIYKPFSGGGWLKENFKRYFWGQNFYLPRERGAQVEAGKAAYEASLILGGGRGEVMPVVMKKKGALSLSAPLYAMRQHESLPESFQQVVELTQEIGEREELVKGTLDLSIQEHQSLLEAFQSFAVFDFLIRDLDQKEEGDNAMVVGSHIVNIDPNNSFALTLPHVLSPGGRCQFGFRHYGASEFAFLPSVKERLISQLENQELIDYLIVHLERQCPKVFAEADLRASLSSMVKAALCILKVEGATVQDLAFFRSEQRLTALLKEIEEDPEGNYSHSELCALQYTLSQQFPLNLKHLSQSGLRYLIS